MAFNRSVWEAIMASTAGRDVFVKHGFLPPRSAAQK